ncbi:MAG TPA: hypothetical protein VFF77_01715 [Holophagaceae bacterium]|jgi:hypothetical protein|nr:hypothetical protein [Holophagaceae bacterium]
MNISAVWVALFIALALSLLLSFVYMVRERGFLSAFFWTFAPLRYWLADASGSQYDDNPSWLDRIQWGLIVTMGLLWLATKAKLIS